MKTKTSEAARRRDIHPAHLFQHIAELAPGLAFDDVWPEIEEDWVRCIPISEHPPASPTAEHADVLPAPDDLSGAAVHVLDKLMRHGKWGNASVTFEALQNFTHVFNRELENVVTELKRKDLLDHDGTGRGTISLNPAKRSAIESTVESRRARAATA